MKWTYSFILLTLCIVVVAWDQKFLKKENFLFRCYNAYAVIAVLLFIFLTIAYDLRTGSGKYTISSNGHCNVHQDSYKTLFLTTISVSIHKLIQIIMFVAYLVYFYEFKMCNAQTGSNLQYDWVLFKITIAMGATIGLSTFVWIFARFPQYLNIVYISDPWHSFVDPTVCNHDLLPVCKKEF